MNVKNILMDLFLTNIQLFTSQNINWWTGVMWITCGLLWCFYQLFGHSFWRHPFTSLVSKWCNAKFLQICSHEETNSSTSWKAYQQIFIFWVNYSFNTSKLHVICLDLNSLNLNLFLFFSPRVKVLEVFAERPLESVFSQLIEPPTEGSLEAAKQRLCALGALTDKESLTPLGWHLACLPVDVRIGKLMLLGAIFRCLDPALTIAASLAFKSPFVSHQTHVEDITPVQYYVTWDPAILAGVSLG